MNTILENHNKRKSIQQIALSQRGKEENKDLNKLPLKKTIKY